MTDKETLFNFLAKYGGVIISSNDLHPDLINQARAAGRMYVDENSLGYIWEPPIAGRFPTNDAELEMFAWCYPLPVIVPEYLNSPEFFQKIIKDIKIRGESTTQNFVTQDGYEPFGDEWKKEMMSWRKNDLVELLKRKLKEFQKLKSELPEPNINP